MDFMRSAVIDIEPMIMSIFLDINAGMMPSQAVGVTTQSSFASSQRASIISISQPLQLPDASGVVKGGYGSAAIPTRTVSADAMPALKTINTATRNSFFKIVII